MPAEDIQRFGRRVARFFAGFDAFLTPTMSAPPLPIGTMASTPEDPWRSLEISGQTVRYAGVVATLIRLAAQLETAQPRAGRRAAVHAARSRVP